MFDGLLATKGVEERFVARSRFGLCALHGGLEQGTAEIAEDIAEVFALDDLKNFTGVREPERPGTASG